jgi:hypothetical protein
MTVSPLEETQKREWAGKGMTEKIGKKSGGRARD